MDDQTINLLEEQPEGLSTPPNRSFFLPSASSSSTYFAPSSVSTSTSGSAFSPSFSSHRSDATPGGLPCSRRQVLGLVGGCVVTLLLAGTQTPALLRLADLESHAPAGGPTVPGDHVERLYVDEADGPGKTCSVAGEDCTASKCCNSIGEVCYQRSSFSWACAKECKPGWACQQSRTDCACSLSCTSETGCPAFPPLYVMGRESESAAAQAGLALKDLARASIPCHDEAAFTSVSSLKEVGSLHADQSVARHSGGSLLIANGAALSAARLEELRPLVKAYLEGAPDAWDLVFLDTRFRNDLEGASSLSRPIKHFEKACLSAHYELRASKGGLIGEAAILVNENFWRSVVEAQLGKSTFGDDLGLFCGEGGVHCFTLSKAVGSLEFVTPESPIAVAEIRGMMSDEERMTFLCDNQCLVDGLSATCKDRILYSAHHELSGSPDACGAATALVHKQCEACTGCKLPEGVCKPIEQTTVPATTVAPAAAVASGCSTTCNFQGETASCADRMNYVFNTLMQTQAKAAACRGAFDTVQDQCGTQCSSCSLNEIFPTCLQ